MPVLPWITAGANILGDVWNMLAQGKANRQARQYATDMYNRQRQDSLADFQMQWNLEKEYNSPQATMKRYKDAGLNPNLIYGNNQIYNPPSVRSSQAEAWKPTAPQLPTNFAESLGNIYDIQLKEAQTDNVRKSTIVAEMEALLKAVQASNVIADTELKGVAKSRGLVDTDQAKFNLKQAQDLKSTSLEAASQGVEKLKAETINLLQGAESRSVETGIALQRNEREIALNNMNLKTGEMNLLKSAEEILNLRMQRAKTDMESSEIAQKIRLLNQDAILKSYDIRLQKMGIKGNYGDVLRILGMLISSKSAGEGIKAMRDGMKDFINKSSGGLTPMDK